MNKFGKIGIAAVSILVVAGCAPTPAPLPEDPPPASVSPTPDATPAVEEVADPVAERADYGFTYFEEADLGGSWDEMSAQLHYPLVGIRECPYYGEVWGTGLVGTYAFMDETDMAAGARFFFTTQGSAPATASFPRNAEGVGVGSSRAEVMAAFPDAVLGSMVDIGAGALTTITVEDPASDSKYVYGFNGGSTVYMLQWGPDAGMQWSHLCGGF